MPNLNLRHDDECDGNQHDTGKAEVKNVIPLAGRRPKLEVLQGGRSAETDQTEPISPQEDPITHRRFERKNLGIGHHNAQRPWEMEQSSPNRVKGKLIGGVFVENHTGNDMPIAASTSIKRTDGVMVTIEFTHRAYQRLLGETLRVPVDIPEDAT